MCNHFGRESALFKRPGAALAAALAVAFTAFSAAESAVARRFFNSLNLVGMDATVAAAALAAAAAARLVAVSSTAAAAAAATAAAAAVVLWCFLLCRTRCSLFCLSCTP